MRTVGDLAPWSVVLIYRKKFGKLIKKYLILLSLKTTETKSMPQFLLNTVPQKIFPSTYAQLRKAYLREEISPRYIGFST